MKLPKKHANNLQQILAILQEEHARTPSDGVRALTALRKAIQANDKPKVLRLLKAYDQGEVLYFRTIPDRLERRNV